MGQPTVPWSATILMPDKSNKGSENSPTIFDATQWNQLYLCKELPEPMEPPASVTYEWGGISAIPDATTEPRAREHVQI